MPFMKLPNGRSVRYRMGLRGKRRLVSISACPWCGCSTDTMIITGASQPMAIRKCYDCKNLWVAEHWFELPDYDRFLNILSEGM